MRKKIEVFHTASLTSDSQIIRIPAEMSRALTKAGVRGMPGAGFVVRRSNKPLVRCHDCHDVVPCGCGELVSHSGEG